ncbi:MAG: EAL domain-containing protein [Limnospira sp.]
MAAALGSCLIVALLVGGGTVRVRDTGETVRVGIYQNRPKVFLDETGRPAGFWPDLLRAIAKAEGWQLQYVPCEWERCLQGVEEGAIDIMVDVAHSPDRDRWLDFNREVVLVSWSEVYTRPGIPLESILDLDRKRVAVLKGSIQQTMLAEQAQAFGVAPQFVEVADFEELFRRIASGEVDAGVVNNIFGGEVAPHHNLVKTNILFDPSRLHFVTAQGKRADLLATLDRHIRDLKADYNSAYYRVRERWLEPKKRLSWGQVRHILADFAVYVPIAGLAVVLMWNRFLRKEICRRREAEAARQVSERRFHNMAANVPGAIFQYVLHPDGSDGVLYVSSGCHELWEVEAADVVADAGILWEMVHPDDRPGMYASVITSADTLQPWSWQWRITTPSGKMKWLEACGRPERRENGDVVWDTLIMDISDRKRAEVALRESEERLRLVTENMGDLVCLHHPDGRYLYVTPSSQILLGYSPEELIGRDPYKLFHPDDRDRIRLLSHEPNLRGITTPATYRIRKKTGEYIWLETLTRAVLDEAGQVLHLQTTSRDVSDRIRVQEQLRHEALHDALTGLPNRNFLIARLDLALKRTKYDPEFHFAVLFLDLDHFKVVNDSLGYLLGDELLLSVAKRLPTFIRETDVAARLGGDEFVILLEEIDGIEAAVRVTEAILKVLRSPLQVGDREVFTGASVGIVAGTSRHRSPEDLLRDADLAMYRAKQNGRGRYAIFDPIMHFQAVRRLHVEHDLRKALENREFVLYYQPIVDLPARTIRGFEALIRWRHPQRGIVSPGEFIEIAEETGLIVPIGCWLLHEACRQLADWQGQFPDRPLKLSVNLSVKQLQHFLLGQLDEILATHALKKNSLVLEITESMLVENVGITCELLEQIRSKGIPISIDDFGTGYSSLSYLHQLPVDALKIDRAFVSPAEPDSRNQTIAESIVVLSNLLELSAIAEGVETVEQLEWLESLGCEAAQGFLFSPPVPADRAIELLKQPALFLRESGVGSRESGGGGSGGSGGSPEAGGTSGPLGN